MFFVCLLTWITGEWYTTRGKLPPSGVKNLSDYLAWRPDADQFVRLPGNRLLVLGAAVGLLPSGPSAVVFDSNGDRLGSCADLGESDAFNSRWGVSYPLQIEGRVAPNPQAVTNADLLE